MTSHSVPAEATPRAKERIATWDNARFVLIALVVVGHMIATVHPDSALGFGTYTFIYLFHIPAMLFLSGMFSRAETTPRAISSTLQLIATWLLWEIIWACIHGFAQGKTPGQSFLVSPAWTLWFLVTLATMRILLPYIVKLRFPLAFAVFVALVSSLFPAVDTNFSASRTLSMLPFFVGGWLVRERRLLEGQWFTRPKYGTRLVGWGIFGAVALVFVCVPGIRETWRLDKWIKWDDDLTSLFDDAPVGDWVPGQWELVALGGFGIAAALMAVAAAMTLALLFVVPRGRSVVSLWGTRTLYVYLLHGPIVWTLRKTGVIDAIGAFGAPGLLLLVALGIGVAVLLSTRWVARVFRLLIEPPIGWMLAREK